MKTILVKPLTVKGLKAIKDHCNSTRLRDQIYMKTLGIKQALVKDILVINIDNASIRLIEQTQPWRMKEFLDKSIEKLTKEMDKLNIQNEIDYEITY